MNIYVAVYSYYINNAILTRKKYMLVGIVWHGIGVLCTLSIVFLVPQIVKMLRAQPRKIKICSVCIGIAAGVVNIVFSIVMLTIFDKIIRIDPFPSIFSFMRMITCVIFFYLGTFLISFAFGSALQKFCQTRAVIYVACIVTAILMAQPMVYGWGKFLLNIASG